MLLNSRQGSRRNSLRSAVLTSSILVAICSSMLDAEVLERVVRFETIAKSGAPVRAAVVILKRTDTIGSELNIPILDGVGTASLPDGSAWAVTVSAPGWWAPPDVVTAGAQSANSSYRLTLWPTGTVHGVIGVANAKDQLPRNLRIHLDNPPLAQAATSIPSGTAAACPVNETGEFTCELPAALIDLTFRTEGYVPVYRWAVRIEAAKDRDLGKLLLRPGASLSGWAILDDGAKVSGARARLQRMVSGNAALPLAARFERIVDESLLDERGFFQLRGIDPGAYTLTIEKQGYAPTVISGMTLYRGSESRLKQTIVLHRPLEITLRITPPLDPSRKPWQYSVLRASELTGSYETTSGSEGSADSGGLVHMPGQTPGHYRFAISDSAENVLARRSFDVTSQTDAHQTISIETIHISGKVTVGERPIKAELWFGGRSGTKHVKSESSADGSYEAILPNAGHWRVQVSASEPRLDSFASTTIDADSKNEAVADLRLADTGIDGQVVDEKGKAVSGAEVAAGISGEVLRARTDPAGNFSFSALPEGTVTLTAEARIQGQSRSSEELKAVLHDGTRFGPVQLKLETSHTINGHVVGAEGPVPGATVSVHTTAPFHESFETATTDLGGRFRIDVPDGATAATAVVSPPGHALRSFDFEINGSPVKLTVPNAGGTLELFYNPPASREPEVLFLSQDGHDVPLSELFRWAVGHGMPIPEQGGLFRIPDMAAAAYRICRVRLAGADPETLRLRHAPASTCKDGYLGLGGTLRLEP